MWEGESNVDEVDGVFIDSDGVAVDINEEESESSDAEDDGYLSDDGIRVDELEMLRDRQ